MRADMSVAISTRLIIIDRLFVRSPQRKDLDCPGETDLPDEQTVVDRHLIIPRHISRSVVGRAAFVRSAWRSDLWAELWVRRLPPTDL